MDVRPTDLSGTMRRAVVSLPARADGWFSVENADSGMLVEARRLGSASTSGEIVNGYVVYDGGTEPSVEAAVARPHAEGLEDYVVLEEPPEISRLEYEFRVPEGVGLRLTSNVLEFVDSGGVPRLRAKAPYAVDSNGETHRVELQIQGCDFDASPAPPFGRASTLPGSASCRLSASWDVGSDAYPMLIDPAWETTGSMVTGRQSHCAASVGTTSALVIGGSSASGTPINTAELWQAGAFSPAGELAVARRNCHAVAVGASDVLVVGGIGLDPAAPLVQAERWQSGLFSYAGSLTPARNGIAVAGLADGRVLVTGGINSSGYVGQAQVWSNNSFSNAGSLLYPRSGHGMAATANGALVVSGSGSSCTGYGASVCLTAELWQGSGFSAAGSISIPGGGAPQSVSLSDGSVITVAGASAYLWTAGTATHAGNTPAAGGIWGKTVTVLPDDSVLVAGGGVSPSPFTALFCPIWNNSAPACRSSYLWSSGSFASAGSLDIPRAGHTASLVSGGSVLLAGGRSTQGGPLASAILWNPAGSDTGNGCADPNLCSTGYCVDGVCCATECAETNEGCAEAVTGLASGQCGPRQVGVLCQGDATCGSGNCVFNVCCDTPCADGCSACIESQTGVSDGTCAPILGGTDPKGACTVAGTQGSDCYVSGTCDGTGQCDTKLGLECVSAVCSSESTLTNAHVCNGSGTCTAAGTSSCGSYRCEAGACLTSCTSNAQCSGSEQCVNGTCGDGLPQGAGCSSASECETGQCVEGVCCNTACAGTCMSCRQQNTALADGSCGAVIPGKADSLGRCTAANPPCGPDGLCDGNGQCRAAAPANTACGVTTCSGLSVQGQLCDGAGQCSSDSTSCEPHACDPATSACFGTCASSAHCAPGYYCFGGTCTAKKAQGDVCVPGQDEACDTGFCRDGVCCNQDCTGTCRSCSGDVNSDGVDGTCGNVRQGFDDPRDGCVRTAAGDCGESGTCDGSGACELKPAGELCGAATCSGAVAVGHECDGFGLCRDVPDDCGNYRCDESTTTCRTTCSTDADCASGSACDLATNECGVIGVTCKDGFTLVQTDGTETDCAPYRCSPGGCRDSCVTETDCAQGYDCLDSSCRVPSGSAVPSSASSESGCGCRLGGDSPRGPGEASLLLLGAAFLLRRHAGTLRRAC